MKKDPAASSANVEIPFQPWVYFFIFFVSNSLLSYFPVSSPSKLWIGTLGIALPFGIALWSVLEKRFKKAGLGKTVSLNPRPLFSFELLTGNPPLWIFILLLSGITFSRFYHLSSYPNWITGDEGIVSNLSASLLQKWDWRLLWGEIQMEPLYIWLLGFFFKLVPPSIFSVRLFCALVSLVTAGLAYWSSRQFFFKKVFLLFFCWLFSLSFISFMLSRLCIPNTLPILFEFFILWMVGQVLEGP